MLRPKKKMIVSDEKTSDSKWLKLVPDLSTICTLEDINMVKPGKIIIKGYAVSGSGREIESLEISLDQRKSWSEASRNPETGNLDNNSASMSFEATIDDVSQTIDVIAREIKVRAIVKNKPPSSQKLIPDLIRSILQRLNFAEFHIARSISPDWYSEAELCNRESSTPWLILFPNKHLDTNVSCKLFDPHGNRIYIVRDLGFDFRNSRCLANSGSWFLILDHRTNFYLWNFFTRERIRLPSMEAMDGFQMRLERVSDTDFFVVFYYEATGNVSDGKISEIRIGNAVLWVDEKSRDYLVMWNLDCFFAYHHHKKGDQDNKSWKVFESQGCVDMVYKANKLYVLNLSKEITVYDFSGVVDDQAPPKKCASFLPDHHRKHRFKNLAVTLSGEVLIIADGGTPWEMFKVYRMDPTTGKWIKQRYIGNQAVFLDLGTMVEAKVGGVERNCIYFSNDQNHRYNRISLCYETNICVYNILTKKVVQRFQHLAASSPNSSFEDARWFFPSFGGKWLH